MPMPAAERLCVCCTSSRDTDLLLLDREATAGRSRDHEMRTRAHHVSCAQLQAQLCSGSLAVRNLVQPQIRAAQAPGAKPY